MVTLRRERRAGVNPATAKDPGPRLPVSRGGRGILRPRGRRPSAAADQCRLPQKSQEFAAAGELPVNLQLGMMVAVLRARELPWRRNHWH